MIVRAFALKDFTGPGTAASCSLTAGTALTSGIVYASSTNVFQFGCATCGQALYGGLHLFLGSTARTLVMKIQSASSSAMTGVVDRITWTLTSELNPISSNQNPFSSWATPVTALSTDHAYWRATWTLSTGGGSPSTGGSWQGLVWMGLQSQ